MLMVAAMLIAAISGSLRKGSYNTSLLREAARLAPAGITVREVDIHDVPLFNGDLEKPAPPDAVTKMREAVTSADGLLLVTPEYNGSIPGPMKNAIDWLSRPPGNVLNNRPVGVIGATPGMGGTRLAQAALLVPLRNLSAQLYNGQFVYVSNAASTFDADGKLTDPKTEAIVTKYIAGFVAYVGALTKAV